MKIGHWWCVQMGNPKHCFVEGRSGRPPSLHVLMGNDKLTSWHRRSCEQAQGRAVPDLEKWLLGEVGAKDMNWGGRKGKWKGHGGVKGLGLRSPEKQVMLVLPLIEQLAVAWLYSVNAKNTFAAVGRYNLFKDVKPHFLQFCSPWVWETSGLFAGNLSGSCDWGYH